MNVTGGVSVSTVASSAGSAALVRGPFARSRKARSVKHTQSRTDVVKQLACLVTLALLSACGGGVSQSGAPPVRAQARARNHTGSNPIQHVVVIMQENRSFDNLFHGFPKANSAMFGYGHGVKYKLQPLPLAWTHDMSHMRYQFLEDYDGGKNDGFDDQIRDLDPELSVLTTPYNHPSCWAFWTGKKLSADGVFLRREISGSAVLDDGVGSTHWAITTSRRPTVPASGRIRFDRRPRRARRRSTEQNAVGLRRTHRYSELLAYGQPRPAGIPAGDFGHEVRGTNPCFTYSTIADLLDAKQISWRTGINSRPEQDSNWSDAFDAIKAVRFGPDYANVVTPDTQVLNDIADGHLKQVSWVMPTEARPIMRAADSGNERPRLGRVDRQRDRSKQLLEQHGDHH